MELLRPLDMLDTIVRVSMEYASFAGGAGSPARPRDKLRVPAQSVAAVDVTMLQAVAISLRSAAEQVILDRQVLLDNVATLKLTVTELTHVASLYRTRLDDTAQSSAAAAPQRRPWRRVACPGIVVSPPSAVDAGCVTDPVESTPASADGTANLQRALDIARADAAFWESRVAAQEGIIDSLERALSIQRTALRSAASSRAHASVADAPRAAAPPMQRQRSQRLISEMPPRPGVNRGRPEGSRERHDWRVHGGADRHREQREDAAAVESNEHEGHASDENYDDERAVEAREELQDAATGDADEQQVEDSRGDGEPAHEREEVTDAMFDEDDGAGPEEEEEHGADASLDVAGSEGSDDDSGSARADENDGTADADMRSSVDDEWPFHVFRASAASAAAGRLRDDPG